MHFFNRIQNKLLAAFFVVVLLPLVGTALYGNWVTSNILRESALDQARAETEERASRIEAFLDGVREDVLVLSELSSLEQLLLARESGSEAEITAALHTVREDFAGFSQQRGIYDQIRFICHEGQEWVRVDAEGSSVRLTAEDDLQDKSHRYYFDSAIGYPQGEVYVSPLDLNREHGEIEQPLQPVIRYAVPVFDTQGERRGIVVANVAAERFLDLVRQTHVAEEDQVMLVDQDGYYLVHPDPAHEWGGPNDLASGHRLQEDYPRARTALLSGGTGESLADRALVYAPVYPNPNDDAHFWVIVYDGSLDTLFAPVRGFQLTAIVILLLALAVAVIMAVWLARNLTAPIRALRAGVEQLGRGGLEQPVEVSSGDEIGELAGAFNDMAGELHRTQTQRRQLLERLITAQEEERRLVAYDIHDGLIQRLVGARMQLSSFMVQRQRDADKAETSLRRSSLHLGEAIAEGRQLVEGLRPATLDDLGLEAALEKIATLVANDMAAELIFESNLKGERLPQPVEITAYRIAQEALSNVRKHAESTEVRVELIRAGHTLIVKVQDSGLGFDPSCAEENSRCVGLMSMRERASLLGGRLEIDSEPDKGTVVTASLPLDDRIMP